MSEFHFYNRKVGSYDNEKEQFTGMCMSAMIGVAGITGTVGAVANVGQ